MQTVTRPRHSETSAVNQADLSPIRVLRVMSRLNVGGPARHAIVLGRSLDAGRYSSLLVYGDIGESEGSLEAELETARVRARKIRELGPGVRPWSDLVAFVRLTRVMFRERPHIVHTHTAKAGTLGRVAAALYNATRRHEHRAAVIHTFHGHLFDGYFGPLTAMAVRVTERGLAQLTDRVVAISARQEHDLSRRYGVAPARKIAVVELGLDLDPLLALENDPRLRHALGLSSRHVVFGFVGRLVPIKDLTVLVQAFARVSAAVEDARLLIVGDGRERPVVERAIAKHGLAGRVRLTGWQEDLRAVYGAIDVGVLSSKSEGTPVALIEAMAAGRPVVAPDVGGVADIVAHERVGFVVPRADPSALVEAMVRLARDRELRERLGSAGRREVAARFTADRLVSATSELYLETLAERRAAALRMPRRSVRSAH